MCAADADVLGSRSRGSFLVATSAIFSAIGSGSAGGFGGSAGGGAGASAGGAAASGLTDAGGLIASGVQNLINRNQAKRDAKKAREFAERMRATAYQTMVKDMTLAGLNPVLGIAHGGASLPSVPQTQGRSPGGDMGTAFRGSAGRLISSARQLKALDDQVATVAAHRRTAEADADVAERTRMSRTELMHQQVSRTGAEALLAEDRALQTRAHRKLTDVDRRLRETEIPSAEAIEAMDRTEFGRMVQWFQRTMGALPAIGVSSGGSEWNARRGRASHRSVRIR